MLQLRGGWELRLRRSLLRNNCDGTFTDVTVAAGLAEPATKTQTAVPVDVNNDGRLDLFIGNEDGAVLVSPYSVPGVMEAMTMSFEVRSAESLDGVEPGMAVEFTLVLEKERFYAEEIQVRHYQPSEQDPLTAQRLKLLERLNAAPAVVDAVRIGQPVPDFSLINQARQTVRLYQFKGKVVGVNFIYTSCALPQFCFRMVNHFGAVHRRFKERMGRDLVLLTVTFDPVRDPPEQLAEYARQWPVDADAWHFLTGDPADVQRVCNLFGLDFFPDEGLMNHSSHTALIDRNGRLAANIEGAQFTATELRDLVQTVLNQ